MTTTPMKLSALTGRADLGKDPEITGMTADSRAVQPGFLFAALPGTKMDGADFIPQAEEAGAFAVLALPGTKANVPVIESDNPRLALAQYAAKLHPGQPELVAGVTGTNGKTSIARFCQQLWGMLGHKAGSLGTLGAYAAGYEYTLRHTTPDPVEIHQVLSTMATLGTTHLAMEVSSHGLSQYRADGVKFSLAAFTNITQDHLDYHPDFDDYFNAKKRLFTELLPEGGVAVVNVDGAGAEEMGRAITGAGRRLFSVGRKGADIRLIETSPLPDGTSLSLEAGGTRYDLHLPLIGYFQAENALVAAGLVIASGHEVDQVMPLLEKLEGAPGRMQLADELEFKDGKAGVYVDFAHTPDAIETALKAIRPHAENRIIIIIGAGGDRDNRKRPLMGKAAAAGADKVIVTDDNPRTEDPAEIRRQVMEGCPDAEEIGGREAAIMAGLKDLQAGDVLLIAGKGHESGQTVGTVTHPFNDREVAQRLVGQLKSATDQDGA
ncbi:UDP-N-acetylmuramoyl-L-alanyl-D-glutamate--2,6-diaminopimelate ligase [Aquisalinus luteolus]|uniref:UDP-N-acetylmuramoyl-L-alanyl-D-glutamate--2,6-diaminopimelate ligase n=2 Tax=Aquisalinus luteolus TaxID=1566827 RepID=A0A8J3ERR2_9PROT|nr:UDP-N-acetylmuramoyl-L-alanyl-D-glutamate--2,6-diaminopimelate ligase [Aquisalinus luteolus]GGI00489.1 UDP-N-acetylmuramoyl-L-alanyl-D-glutamate--2,6-diaminopimelate ligase [Aquisalinus luteolus]